MPSRAPTFSNTDCRKGLPLSAITTPVTAALAPDEAKFVTGSELVIDGGYTAQ